LRYDGEHLQPIKAFDEEDRVIYLGTFSKILVPGFRLGWVVASEEIIRKLVIAKQSTDLCTNTFVQHVTYEFIERGLLDPHIEKLKKVYKRKRDIMLEAMERYFPKGVKWTVPEGGLFTWVTLPHEIDTREMLPKALEKKVAYVTGSAFFVDGSGTNTMRLNFSHASDDKIVEGIRRLALVIKREMKKPTIVGEVAEGI
jgi:2-aminoadipate transaminase